MQEKQQLETAVFLIEPATWQRRWIQQDLLAVLAGHSPSRAAAYNESQTSQPFQFISSAKFSNSTCLYIYTFGSIFTSLNV